MYHTQTSLRLLDISFPPTKKEKPENISITNALFSLVVIRDFIMDDSDRGKLLSLRLSRGRGGKNLNLFKHPKPKR